MTAQQPKRLGMPQDISAEVPAWAQEAQDHFQEKGFYRASDIQKILGDPGVSVTSAATIDPPDNNIWKRIA